MTDQDRNILSHQVLLLGFLRSVAPFLVLGSVPSVNPRKKKKRTDEDGSDDEKAQEEDDDAMSEDENALPESPASTRRDGMRGTVMITLRNVSPYTKWYFPFMLSINFIISAG